MRPIVVFSRQRNVARFIVGKTDESDAAEFKTTAEET
jgi:hypothetical protein